MKLFEENGHLTDPALRVLADGGALTELERLEASEHLSYCDDCLLRYTQLLTPERLEMPPEDCRRGIWHRIHRRMARFFASRYATAAAALVVVAALWTFGSFAGAAQPSWHPVGPGNTRPSAVESWQDWPRRWDQALSKGLSGFQQLFNVFGGADMTATKGGTK